MAKPKDLVWEEALLLRRLEFVRNLRSALQTKDSLAAVTVEAYTSVIDEIIDEAALTVHRAVKTGADDLGDVVQRQAEVQAEAPVLPVAAPALGSKGQVDVFGNAVPPVALDQVACPCCHRRVTAGRFAPHLEKCMGRGRQASRNAARRLSTLAPDL